MDGAPNGGVFTPTNLGLYSYTTNNPVNFVDPDGLAKGDAALKRFAKAIKAGEEAYMKALSQTIPRNMERAGKRHRITGVPFTKDGYPDFGNYLYKGSKGKAEVQLEKFTNHKDDRIIADRLAGFKETPDGYTWHHKEDGTTMQLVQRSIHKKTGHTGGNTIYKKAIAISAAISATTANAWDGIKNSTTDDWVEFGGEMLLDVVSAPFTSNLEAPELQPMPTSQTKRVKRIR